MALYKSVENVIMLLLFQIIALSETLHIYYHHNTKTKSSRGNVMRRVINSQLRIGETPIGNIKFDLKSRDEITKLLIGLQYIYTKDELREAVFDILENMTPDGVNPYTGRTGMDYWKVLILGSIRLGCNWDYDKLKEIADNHNRLRQMLGHSIIDFDDQYPLQTIKDNIRLFTPEVLDRISKIVVKFGQSLLGCEEGDMFHARCDSWVAKTNVHYPTDINLLLDAVQKVITLLSRICQATGTIGWGQSPHNKRKVKKLYRKAQNLKHSTSNNEKKKAEREQLIKDAHLAYLDVTGSFMDKAIDTVEYLREEFPMEEKYLLKIERFIGHAERQIEQTYRRVIFGEKIPHVEKVFSIFEEHTEWITKGKAGVPQELGLRVCIMEDQHGFIIHHKVMQNETDDEVPVSMVTEAKEYFPNLFGCSFDKGFWSPENREELNEILDRVVLPKKGKCNLQELKIETDEEFIKARRQHSAVESAINALQNHGLDRCLDRGIVGFKRYVSLGVLSRNIHLLGNIIQQKEFKREQRIEIYRATWAKNHSQVAV